MAASQRWKQETAAADLFKEKNLGKHWKEKLKKPFHEDLEKTIDI